MNVFFSGFIGNESEHRTNKSREPRSENLSKIKTYTMHILKCSYQDSDSKGGTRAPGTDH